MIRDGDAACSATLAAFVDGGESVNRGPVGSWTLPRRRQRNSDQRAGAMRIRAVQSAGGAVSKQRGVRRGSRPTVVEGPIHTGQEEMPLERTESEPLQQKAIHAPLAVQLRHTPGSPRASCAAPAATAMGNDFHCPNVMVDVDACIRFQHTAVTVRKQICQYQRSRVRLTLDDLKMQIEGSRDTRDHRPIARRQLGDELRETHVVRLVDSDEPRDVANSESCPSRRVNLYRHRGPVRPDRAKRTNSRSRSRFDR